MRTFEGGVAVGSRRAQVARDLRVLRRMVRLVSAYFLTGALLRRRYREKQRRGEVFFVDEELGR